MKVSVFAEIKNEVDFIGYSIMSVLPYVDELVYTDGNSTDGTIDLIKHIIDKYDKDKKIKLFEGRDCVDLKEDYVRHVNDTIKLCTGDWLMHLHPDMIMLNAQTLRDELKKARYDYGVFVNVKSYSGEYEEFAGRQTGWCLIFKHTPGFEFRGFYGTPEEGFYFREFGEAKSNLCNWQINFPVNYSAIRVNHLCEMKGKERRLDKMLKVLRNINTDKSDDLLAKEAADHPRVSLDCSANKWGRFEKRKTNLSAFGPFSEYADEFSKFKK